MSADSRSAPEADDTFQLRAVTGLTQRLGAGDAKPLVVVGGEKLLPFDGPKVWIYSR